MEVDLRRLADLVRLPVGQEAELRLVLLARDRQRAVGDDRVAEPVGARDAEDVRPAFLVVDLQLCREFAGLRVGDDRRSETSRSAISPLRTIRFRTATLRVCPVGLPCASVAETSGQRLAVEVDVAGRREAIWNAADRQHHVGRRPRRCPRRARAGAQRLLLGEPLGRELDVELPRRVGPPALRSPPGKTTSTGRFASRRAVLVPGHDVGLDRLAAEVDRLRRSNARSIFSSRTTGPRTRRRSRSCPAGRGGRGTCRPGPPSRGGSSRGTCRTPRASPAARPGAGPGCRSPPAGTARRPGRRTGRPWPRGPRPAAPPLARPVRRPVGVDVGPRREPLRHLAGHAQAEPATSGPSSTR